MKARSGVAAAAMVARVAAQAPPVYGGSFSSSATPAVSPSASLPVSYTTVTIEEDCPTSSYETLITVTSGVTVTWCPECEHASQTTPTTPKGPGYTTTYTTTYLSLCPTGLVPATYTVTESCTDEQPTFTPGPSHIPNGFTVTVKECSVCDKTQSMVTITEPCGCEATSGKPVPPKTTPAAPAGPFPTGGVVTQISDGQVQAPTGNTEQPAPVPSPSACDGADCGGSGNTSPAPSACNGEDCGGAGNQSPGNTPVSPSTGGAGSAPPYPTGSATTVQCPGPECRAKATGGAAMPSGGSPAAPGGGEGGSGSTPSSSSSAPIEPAPSGYTGAAASVHMGYVASIVLSVVVGGLAFAL